MTSFSSMLRSARRVMTAGLCIVFLATLPAGTAVAQEPAAPPESETAQPPKKAETPVLIETRTKGYVLEGIIFAALCGATLYAVCRSSPRGR